MPVLPDVGSMIRPPGLSEPSRSAASIMKPISPVGATSQGGSGVGGGVVCFVVRIITKCDIRVNKNISYCIIFATGVFTGGMRRE